MVKYDVVVVGAGNAALSSALAAKDNGAKNFSIRKACKKNVVEIANIQMELIDLPIMDFQI